MLLNSFFFNMRDTVSTRVTEGVLGTGDAALSFSDTDLTTPVASTEGTFDSSICDAPLLVVKEYLLPITGDNNTYTEYGCRNSGGTLYFRINVSAFTKTSYMEIPAITRVEFLRGQGS